VASRLGDQPAFSGSAVTFFVTLPKRRQRKLLDRAHELADDPFLAPDFYTHDHSGREISHLVVDDFLFDFWIDHATKRVVITDIEDAE
jgi:hypothetical protein